MQHLYQRLCKIDYASGDLGSKYNITYGQCLDLCDKTATCVGVSHVSGQNPWCYMKKALTIPLNNQGVSGAALVGASPCGNLLDMTPWVPSTVNLTSASGLTPASTVDWYVAQASPGINFAHVQAPLNGALKGITMPHTSKLINPACAVNSVSNGVSQYRVVFTTPDLATLQAVAAWTLPMVLVTNTASCNDPGAVGVYHITSRSVNEGALRASLVGTRQPITAESSSVSYTYGYLNTPRGTINKSTYTCSAGPAVTKRSPVEFFA